MADGLVVSILNLQVELVALVIKNCDLAAELSLILVDDQDNFINCNDLLQHSVHVNLRASLNLLVVRREQSAGREFVLEVEANILAFLDTVLDSHILDFLFLRVKPGS